MANCYVSVWHFLRLHRWRPTTGKANGTSWIEIFARFYSIGGMCSMKPPPVTAIKPEGSMKMQLGTFTQVCRNIIRIYAEPLDQMMF